MEQPLCTINAKKLDGQIYRSWKAKLIDENSEYWLFIGIFDREIFHSDLGVIKRGTVSYEYYWKKRWYNIFRFESPSGDFRNFYCNINQPPNFSGTTLDYIDLDLDIIVQKDFSYKVLDIEEFKNNANLYNYPLEIKEKVKESVLEIKKLIKNRAFPFDYLQEII